MHSYLVLQCGQSKLQTIISRKWGIFVSSMVVVPCTLQGSPEELLLSARLLTRPLISDSNHRHSTANGSSLSNSLRSDSSSCTSFPS